MGGAFWSWVKVFLTSLVDAITPPRERARRARERTLADLQLAPQEFRIGRLSVTALLDYREKAVQETIQTLKYDGTQRAAIILADALADYLHEEMHSLRAFSPRPIILVPVPLHKTRERERGFNQIRRILDALPPEFRDGTLSRISPALTRIRATPQQTRLARSERLKNVVGAFVADETLARKTHAILIDDVCTTGATISEGAKALQAVGAKVTALALARA